jgi:UDP-3-O-[3-hydroxymyristoyl] N-acetylglucosamine deacetylase
MAYSHYQTTLAQPVEFKDIGVHSGTAATLRVLPAPAHHGLVFIRCDIAGNPEIPASWSNVTDTRLCTKMTNAYGASISTIEHVMSALAGLGIDNAILVIDGPEIPIMDGSARVFVEALLQAGLVRQNALRQYIKVLKPVEFVENHAKVVLAPADESSFEFMFDFSGRTNLPPQHLKYTLTPESFVTEIAGARTFGLMEDAEKLWSVGLALGASMENTVVIGQDAILNPEGLRFENEFVRHKILDAVGDLYCAGAPIMGAYQAIGGGHRLNNLLLHRLFDTPGAWAYVTLADPLVAPIAAPVLSKSFPRPEAVACA